MGSHDIYRRSPRLYDSSEPRTTDSYISPTLVSLGILPNQSTAESVGGIQLLVLRILIGLGWGEVPVGCVRHCKRTRSHKWRGLEGRHVPTPG